jgi:hypothetical protein
MARIHPLSADIGITLPGTGILVPLFEDDMFHFFLPANPNVFLLFMPLVCIC